MARAICTNCGHKWSLRKDPAEIALLRCSACDETGETIELIERDQTNVTTAEQAQRQGEIEDILGRIEQIREQIEDVAPPDKPAPSELRKEWGTITTLQDQLADETDISAADVQEADKLVEDIRETVEATEQLEIIGDLEARIADLEVEIITTKDRLDELETEEQNKLDELSMLSQTRDDYEQDIEQLRQQVQFLRNQITLLQQQWQSELNSSYR